MGRKQERNRRQAFYFAAHRREPARNIYAKIGIQKATELCVWWFCNKCGVPVGLDPLKRAFIATVLLLAFLPYELRPDTDNFTQRTTARTTRTIRAQRRKGREEELLTPFNITA